MKNVLKSALLSIVLLAGVVGSSFALAQEPQEPTMLPEVGISCLQHTVDYTFNLGFVSFTYHVLYTVCDNGTEYADLV
jgi:hypothetical protein